MDPSWCLGGLRMSVVERERQSLDSGQPVGATDEVGQSHHQVREWSKIYGLGDYNSVVYKIEGFPKAYKSESRRSATL